MMVASDQAEGKWPVIQESLKSRNSVSRADSGRFFSYGTLTMGVLAAAVMASYTTGRQYISSVKQLASRSSQMT